jgi:hypothetical protein
VSSELDTLWGWKRHRQYPDNVLRLRKKDLFGKLDKGSCRRRRLNVFSIVFNKEIRPGPTIRSSKKNAAGMRFEQQEGL